MTEFERLDNDSAVYRLDAFDGPTPINAPARVKSHHAEKNNVNYENLRATVEEVDSILYVVVGECV